MREIVLDTETTGLDPLRGDRLVEIGCVEIFNRMPTGQTFHRHINPERDMPAKAFNVHGFSSESVADKPLFAHVVEDFLEFIGDAPLVIHNASPMNSRKSSTTWANSGLSARNSLESPCTLKASAGMS